MNVTDKTGASEAEFRARIALFEADDSNARRLAWFTDAELRAELDNRAALPPSPAEEAVKRIEALAEERGRAKVAGWALLLADEFEGLGRTNTLIAAEFAKKGDLVLKQWHLGLAEARRISAERIRAALDSPAPAPQGGGQR